MPKKGAWTVVLKRGGVFEGEGALIPQFCENFIAIPHTKISEILPLHSGIIVALEN